MIRVTKKLLLGSGLVVLLTGCMVTDHPNDLTLCEKAKDKLNYTATRKNYVSVLKEKGWVNYSENNEDMTPEESLLEIITNLGEWQTTTSEVSCNGSGEVTVNAQFSNGINVKYRIEELTLNSDSTVKALQVVAM